MTENNKNERLAISDAIRRIYRLRMDGLDVSAIERDLLLAAPQAQSAVDEIKKWATEAPALRRQLEKALEQNVWHAVRVAKALGQKHPWFLDEARPMLTRTVAAQAKAGLISGVPHACDVFTALDQLWPMTAQDTACAAGIGPMRCAVPSRARTHPEEFPQFYLDGSIVRWRKHRISWPACRTSVAGRGIFPSDMAPAPAWDVYIDEAGEKFSSTRPGEPGIICAVCIPEDSGMQDPGALHCYGTSNVAGTRLLELLLAGRCALLGFSAHSLGLPGWWECVCQLAVWCARLLPAGQDGMEVRFHVEQRKQFGPEHGQALLEKTRNLLWDVDLARAALVRIPSFSIECKGSPMLAWADVAAWSWGRWRRGSWPGFTSTGLPGRGFSMDTPQELAAASDILAGNLPDTNGWPLLQKDFLPGSIPERALRQLESRLQENGSLRQEVLRTMESMALQGTDCSQLERFGALLERCGSDSPLVAFYARLNAMRQDAQALAPKNPESYACPSVPDGFPLAPLHMALRKADLACATLRPQAAESLLAPWDPRLGKSLPDEPCAAARVLALFGRCAAMENGMQQAYRLFNTALERLGDKNVPIKRQLLALRSCAASQGRLPNAETMANEALGMRWQDALEAWWQISASKRRMLARLLATSGHCGKAGTRWTSTWVPAESRADENDPALLLFRGMAAPDTDSSLRQLLKQEAADIPLEGHPVKVLHAAAIKLALDAASKDAPEVRGALAKACLDMPHLRKYVGLLLAENFGPLQVLPFAFLPASARAV